MDVARLFECVFAGLASGNPAPKIELDYVNHYTLLVAIILSAQTNDKIVNRATKSLFQVVDSPEAMLDLGLEGLVGYIRSIGLFNSKAKNILATSTMLLENFQGNIPETLEDLILLPGVGRKTAKVYLNTACGAHCIPVDRHVYRVSHRIGLSAANSLLGVEKDLENNTPVAYLGNAHHWLVLHGRYTCLAQKPKCPTCPVKHYCQSFEQLSSS